MGNYWDLIAPMKTNGVSIDIVFHMSKNKMDSRWNFEVSLIGVTKYCSG